MPAFGQISDEEYVVLRPYLDRVAGLGTVRPGPRTISEPADRVGELIVKGTCHICHDATSPNQRPTTVLSDVIPSLASLTQDKSVADVIHKVRHGAPTLLSVGGVLSRGRMPVLDYLTEPEVVSAVLVSDEISAAVGVGSAGRASPAAPPKRTQGQATPRPEAVAQA